jgi:hypothetical protein
MAYTSGVLMKSEWIVFWKRPWSVDEGIDSMKRIEE